MRTGTNNSIVTRAPVRDLAYLGSIPSTYGPPSPLGVTPESRVRSKC